ncbi:hypothetical protein B296_00011652 [Ensete ventricosum]|uniref:EF-hand domain-containing protein n=1 Tax=Ensete ventricosum TaxID=4639 RepID=A0A427A0A9_ENSVE|nr:hypothetical protein B296_00011652 [Ensete ventricosum]
MSLFLASALRKSPIRSRGGVSAWFGSFAAAEKERDLGALGRAVAGVLAVGGSAIGLCMLPSFSSFPDSSLSFADSNLEPSEPEHPMASDDVKMEKKSKFLFAGVTCQLICADSYRRRVFFKYEKRIRMRSSPEKVFFLNVFIVCGISLTESMVDVIFHVFDTNRDGNLSSEEFLRALQRRESDACQPSAPGGGIMGLLSCWLQCANNCSRPQAFS